MSNLGTLFVDELAFVITNIWLDDGRMWFRARRPGPVAKPGSQWRIHAPDGSVVMLANVDVKWPRRPASTDGETIVELPIGLEGSRPGEQWASQEVAR